MAKSNAQTHLTIEWSNTSQTQKHKQRTKLKKIKNQKLV